MNVLVILVRYLIGFAFIPSGMVKLLGLRFTSLPTSNPVGYFFDAMYKTGIYWYLLGLAQVVAAGLLMTQRFAALGSAVYFTIMVNIWAITVGVNFQGTWVITSLMLLASLFLIVWDAPKFRPLLLRETSTIIITPSKEQYVPAMVWTWLGVFLFAFFFAVTLLFRYVAIFKTYAIPIFLTIGVFVLALVLLALCKEWIHRSKATSMDATSVLSASEQ